MSKHLLPSLLVLLGSVTLTFGEPEQPPTAPATPLAATRPSPPPPAEQRPSPGAPPADDPFVRAARAPKKAPEPPPAAVPPAVNLLATVETWAVSQEDFAELLDGPASEGAPYGRLEELAKAGRAKLVALIAVNTKSGQRAVVEAIDELIHATEFDPGERPGENSFPTAWETRNTGETLEIEPILGPDDKMIDINLMPQTVRFRGFKDLRSGRDSGAVAQPDFQREKLTSSVTVQSGRPLILATATPNASDGAGGNEIFIRALRVTAQPVLPGPPVETELLDARIDVLLYSLEREGARRILNESADSAQSYASVRELVVKGGAQLEVVSSFVTKSGQRAVNEESFEFRYPTSNAFLTRNVGVTVEIEPVLAQDARFVDINLVPQVVRLVGTLMAEGVAAQYPPMPVFTSRRVTTSVSSGGGIPVLIGTMSHPRDTGVNDRQDDGRTTLAYVRVTPVAP